jgi:hypothetical protein
VDGEAIAGIDRREMMLLIDFFLRNRGGRGAR